MGVRPHLSLSSCFWSETKGVTLCLRFVLQNNPPEYTAM
ncbi:hypothetical protein VPHK449_0050 [Vibrio phage K449]